jgi:hypothetical protein
MKDSSISSETVFPRHLFWIILSCCILIQGLALRQTFNREIEGTYPFAYDQSAYLTQVYEAYEKSRDEGLVAGLKEALLSPGRPQGVLLQGEATLLSTVLGASRGTCLATIFAQFALLQVVLLLAFRRITGAVDWGFLAIGLTLLTTSRYFYAGGLDDFRLDLAASSLYGSALCALLASNYFANQKWSIAFALLSAALIATRFIAVTYTLIAATLTLALVLVETRRKPTWAAGVPRMRLAIIAVFGSVVLVLPLFFANFTSLYQYYFVGHLQSSEGPIRAAEQGVYDWQAAMLFYPLSLVSNHLGSVFVRIVGLLLGLFVIVVTLDRRAGRKPTSGPEDARNTPLDIAVSIVWVLVPLGLFTFDIAKSPVVASTMVVPVVTCVVLILHFFRPTAWQIRRAFAAIVLLLGVAFTVSAHLKRRPAFEEMKGLKDLYAAVDQIALDAVDQRGRTIKFATDSLAPYLNGNSAKMMIYERGGPLVATQEVLAGTVLTVPKEQALEAIDVADYALVTLSKPSSENSVLPFDRAMASYRSDLRRRAFSQMILMSRVQVSDHTFEIFARPAFRLAGKSGDWLSSEGATLTFPAAALKDRPYLLLSGRTYHSDQFKDGLKCNAFLLPARLAVPSIAHMATDSYAIALDLTKVGAEQSRTVEIALEFPTYFVPAERNINSDTRKLSVLAPSSYRLVASKSEYPPELNAQPPAKR